MLIRRAQDGRASRVIKTPGSRGMWMPENLCPALYGDREKYGHVPEYYVTEPVKDGAWIDRDGALWNVYNVTGPEWREIRWAVTPGAHMESGEMEFVTKHLDLFPAKLLE